jgi:protein-L-isoaspartate(D-aspartate) O-methyltransferase
MPDPANRRPSMTTDFSLAREHMVLSQLQPSGVITPAVLDAFLATPRELFVPADRSEFCYADGNLTLDGGRTLLEPMVLAKMVEVANVRGHETVLCLGGVTGYGAAIVSKLAQTVVDLECDDRFGGIQRAAVEELGLGNIMRVIGDFNVGAPAKGPYDVILIEGAMVNMPSKLLEQLKPGGRLLGIQVPERARMGAAVIFEKGTNGEPPTSRPLFDAWVPYLPGCGPVVRFAFN